MEQGERWSEILFNFLRDFFGPHVHLAATPFQYSL